MLAAFSGPGAPEEASAPGRAEDEAWGRSSFVLARWLFLRLLGVVFLVALGSLWTQIDGLIGSRGISPAVDFLAFVRNQLGGRSYWQIPTLLWLGASDRSIHLLCASGMVLSFLLIIGVAPRWILVLLWGVYLSLASVGDVFLHFQWDNLLLETSFLAVFLAPAGWRPQLGRRLEAPLPLWLLRWLLFRVMFLSGLVKLLSGDPTWRNLTALRFHYWTQPLPTWIGYYAHQLPASIQTACAALMFVIELAVPFLIFGPRRVRLFAAAALALFQLAIAATGNYGFFNLLTLALCVLLVDDRALSRIAPKSLRQPAAVPSSRSRLRRPMRLAFGLGSLLIVVLSVAEMRFWRGSLPEPIEGMLAAIQPFRSLNSYGLFAVMTTQRPEVEVEGSNEGWRWQPYQFKWKPGRPERASQFVAPHQPRLDWQMWFLALGSCARSPWFIRLQQRLLQGSPEVLGLLQTNPFPSAPPRYIRSVLYQYRFSEWSDWKTKNAFWSREKIGAFCPVLALQDGKLVAVQAVDSEVH
jgi:hypothetical protein